MTVSDFLNKTELSKQDSKYLLEYVLKKNDSFILNHPDYVLTTDEEKKLRELETKRQSGLALAYVTEERAFYKDVFYTPQGVLIPQPDTETLVEEAIKIAVSIHQSADNISILDICTGSGCIGISVAKELAGKFRTIDLTLSDISKTALNIAAINAHKILRNTPNIHVTENLGNLFENLSCRYDLILTNPPYIETSVIPTLENEVQQEPLLALDGGTDGLDIIRKIIVQAKDYMKKGSRILMEIGYNQAESVSELFRQNNYSNIDVVKDLGNRDRVVKACL